jgi:hypothetical protein
MTYIQPHQNNNKISFLISALTLASMGAAVWGVFLYNQLIDLRHEVSIQGKTIKQSEVENAELKNNFYQVFNAKNFESLAEEKSLVLEKKPEYVKLNSSQLLTTNN